MTSSAMRGLRRGLVLAATGIILATGPVHAQDVDDPLPEPQQSQLPPGAVVQPLDTGPGAELRSNLRTLAANPRSLDALIGAGRAAIGLRDAEAATGFFTRAQEISPDDPRVKAGLGSAALLGERPEQALILFAEAVQRGAPEAEIAGDRGLAHDMVGDPRRAQQDYALALRRRTDPEIERRLALSLAISGQRDAALRVIDGQLRRNDRAAWRTQAFVLALTGDPAGADDTARRLMPAPNAQAMAPFFARLASLSPAQKAAAVNFGRFPSDGRTRMASNVDTSADPGALAMAQGGARPHPAPPLAEPVNHDARRRPGEAETYAGSMIRRSSPLAPAVQRPQPVQVAQAPVRRFQPPAPDPDEGDQADDQAQAEAQASPPQQGPAYRPREAPAFVPGGNFTLDTRHEETMVQPAQTPATPGFGTFGPAQSPSVSQFQSITVQPAAPVAEAPASRPAMADIASMVRALPDEQASGAIVQPPVQAPAAMLSPAERQSRDAAAREAEARYRGQGAPAPAGTAAARASGAGGRSAGDGRSAGEGRSAGGGRHWVQIAHGAQPAALSVQYRQVRAQAPALIDSRTAWTAADRSTNRLLIGPFDSESDARDYIDQLGARRIAAIPWESGAGQPVERLRGGGASAARARPDQADRAPASTARSGRARQADERAAASDERRASHGRSGRAAAAADEPGGGGRSARDRAASDERTGGRSRSARDRAASDERTGGRSHSARDRAASDERGGGHGRSARDRAASDEPSAARGRSARDRAGSGDRAGARSGRAAADDGNGARARSGRDRTDAADARHGRGRPATRGGSADEAGGSSHSRSGHGRASADDAPRTSRNRSSQEPRQAAHDTRTARGRSSQEQRPAPRGRRSH